MCVADYSSQTVSSDTFCVLFLYQVANILAKDPSRECLHELLKCTSPSMTRDQVLVKAERDRAFKILKSRIHPDRHSQSDLAKDVFQSAPEFFHRCCDNIYDANQFMCRGRKRVPQALGVFPHSFHVEDKWQFLGTIRPVSCLASTETQRAALVAYRCINARGAIAHGKETGIYFGKDAIASEKSNTERIFKQNGGGIKKLRGAKQIKEELLARGPVVSKSVSLSHALLSSSSNPHSFPVLIGHNHTWLIVGWERTLRGEMWVIHVGFRREDPGKSIIKVPFGKYGIDDACIAPKSTFKDVSWQLGPYLDILPTSEHWRERPSINLSVPSGKMNKLGDLFACGLGDAITNEVVFETREKRNPAHSRTSCLKEVLWDKGQKRWIVSIALVR